MFRIVILLLLGGLAGCANPAPVVGLAIADLASVTVFHRGLIDLAYSAATGRDCSVVRLDRGQSWCARPAPAPMAAYCTQTLGTVQCWQGPAPGNPATSLADGPAWGRPTAAPLALHS